MSVRLSWLVLYIGPGMETVAAEGRGAESQVEEGLFSKVDFDLKGCEHKVIYNGIC